MVNEITWKKEIEEPLLLDRCSVWRSANIKNIIAILSFTLDQEEV